MIKIINKKSGFTLIELLLVIAIMGILATLISTNLINSLKKGHDTTRKMDLQNVQKALEMYYEDKKTYPTAIIFAGRALCDGGTGDTSDTVTACQTAGKKIYITKIPSDPNPSANYFYERLTANGAGYRLYSYLENTQDIGVGTTGVAGGDFGILCLSAAFPCRYKLTGSNYQ